MRTTTVISTITLAAAVLAGCSDEPVPKEPGRTASPTTTANTETPPPMPEQASQNSAEGAAAFLDHYLDVMNYASHTGDVAPLEELSLDTCSGCQKYIETYVATYEAGGNYSGGDWAAGGVQMESVGAEVLMNTVVTVADGEYRTSKNAETLGRAGGSYELTFAAVRGDEGWQVSQMFLGAPA